MRVAVLVLVAGCGRIGFDPFGASGDGPPGGDAAIDTPVIPAGPVLWLEMETVPTSGIVDSGANHDVTCGGGCPTRVAGLHGMGYGFDTNIDIDVTFRADLSTDGGFTAALWLNIPAIPTAQQCVFNQPSAVGDSYVICVQPDGSPFFDNEDAGGNANSINGDVLALGAWHHLAFVWDGTVKSAYQDGVFLDMTTFGVGSSILGLNIGSIAGTIDDVVFYDRALTAAEVAQLATP